VSAFPQRATVAAVAASAIALLTAAALLVLIAILELDPTYTTAESLASGIGDILIATAFVLTGALVAIKRPGNLIGWVLLASGFLQFLSGAFRVYAELALLAKPDLGLPAGVALAVIDAASWTALMAGVFLLLVLFPTGRPASRRWRNLAVVITVGFGVVWFILSTAPGQLDPPFDAYTNPLAVTSSKAYIDVGIALIVPCLVSVGIAAIGLLLRFRRSRGAERQQFKWFAASAGLLLLTLPISAAFDWSNVAGAAFSIALFLLPVSIGVAVLRYRLYEIDRIVNRGLVYLAVSALLAGLYFGIVLGLQQIFSGLTRGNDLAIAGSTLAVAALFRPARRRIQAFVDRRFYRRRYDAERTLMAFGSRLRDEVDLAELGTDLGRVVRETMQPAHVSLWIRRDSGVVAPPVTISGRSGARKDWR